MHDEGYFDDHVATKYDESAADKFDQRSSTLLLISSPRRVRGTTSAP
jgi:hypothetical protein